MEYIWIGVLFFLLSPGVLITLPSVGNKMWMSGKTCWLSALIHACIFSGIIYFLQNRNEEGFRIRRVVDTPVFQSDEKGDFSKRREDTQAQLKSELLGKEKSFSDRTFDSAIKPDMDHPEIKKMEDSLKEKRDEMKKEDKKVMKQEGELPPPVPVVFNPPPNSLTIL